MSWRIISRPMRSSRSRSNPKSSSRLMAYAQMEKPVARPWKSPYFSWISTCTPAPRNASATAHPPTPPPTITTFFSSAIHTPRDGRSEAAGHAAKSGAARRLSRRRHATAAGQQEARPAHERAGENVEHEVVRCRHDDQGDRRRIGECGPSQRRRPRGLRDRRADDNRVRHVDARHGGDRVVEPNHEPGVEVDPAFADRVSEPLERARRGGRGKEESGARADGG